VSIKIENNIPIPPKTTNVKSSPVRRALFDLEPGDSFLVHSRVVLNGYIKEAKTVRPDRMFTTRKVENGVRVWRVQ